VPGFHNVFGGIFVIPPLIFKLGNLYSQNSHINASNNGSAINKNTADLIIAQLLQYGPSKGCEILCVVIDQYMAELKNIIQTHNQIASDAEINMEQLADALRKLKIQTETALENKRNGIPNNPQI